MFWVIKCSSYHPNICFALVLLYTQSNESLLFLFCIITLHTIESSPIVITTGMGIGPEVLSKAIFYTGHTSTESSCWVEITDRISCHPAKQYHPFKSSCDENFPNTYPIHIMSLLKWLPFATAHNFV